MMFVCFPVDVTTNFRGYNGDLNETLFVGNVDDKSKDLVRVTHECLSQAIQMGELVTLEKLIKSCSRDIVCVIGEYIANCTMLCTCVLPLYFLIYLLFHHVILVKPGVLYRDLGNVIQRHAQKNGLSVVRSYCGHGIHQ